jgi:cell division protein FtsI (penicillin-binding protein 3)
LKALKECLVGVCKDSGSTAFSIFKNEPFTVGGKTGTALVANGSRGYADHIYQSSFVGFFPAENPQYTIEVTIKNKPHARMFYGALVAGPVFKEIAERLYAMYVKTDAQFTKSEEVDTDDYVYKGRTSDIKSVMNTIGVSFKNDVDKNIRWSSLTNNVNQPELKPDFLSSTTMPELAGMGLKDAIDVCENMGLRVNVKGKGKVASQSVSAGQKVEAGEFVNLELN